MAPVLMMNQHTGTDFLQRNVICQAWQHWDVAPLQRHGMPDQRIPDQALQEISVAKFLLLK
jgi:hypothetical protein